MDVRLQVEVAFRVAPEAHAWGAGPLLFDLESGTTPPVLKSGTMPKASGKAGNEIVIIQFKVSSEGEVGDLRSLQGQESASLSMLMTNLAKWKFAPASNGTAPIPATGRCF